MDDGRVLNVLSTKFGGEFTLDDNRKLYRDGAPLGVSWDVLPEQEMSQYAQELRRAADSVLLGYVVQQVEKALNAESQEMEDGKTL
jgi:hypothetical protein